MLFEFPLWLAAESRVRKSSAILVGVGKRYALSIVENGGIGHITYLYTYLSSESGVKAG